MVEFKWFREGLNHAKGLHPLESTMVYIKFSFYLLQPSPMS